VTLNNTVSGVTKRGVQTESKSMLGSSGMGMSHSIVEEAAQARLKKIEAEHPNPSSEPHTSGGGFFRTLWNTTLLTATAFTGVAGYYTYAYETKDLEEIVKTTRKEEAEENIMKDVWCQGMEKYLKFRKNIEGQIKEYADPTFDKLLPDMPPEIRGRVKTLVLDLDEVLVHKEWTRQRGWSIYKRPGVQDFLAEMGQYFEIVVFSEEPNTYVDPIINRLDTSKVVTYRLYRPETQYHDGKHVKDLSKLNRDLNQVLMISSNPDAWSFQPENTLKLKPWCKETDDTTLLDLVPFLQMIAMRGVKDVREVVKSYDNEPNIPKAFKDRMKAAADSQKQQSTRRRSFLSLR